MRFGAEELKEWSGGDWTRFPAGPVCGFSYDSRRIRPGELFLCFRTERRDGHDFVADAVKAGAVAALVERPVPGAEIPQLVVDDPLVAFGRMGAAHRRRFEGPVIGVTGSCGKTTTKDLLALLLGGEERVHATEGNFNNRIGVPLTLLGLDPERHRFAVIEAGIDRPGEMEALAEMIRPTHGIVTVIAPAHLEALGDLEGVAREKSILVRDLPHFGAAVVPSSCLLYEGFHDLPAPVFHVAPDEDLGVREADARFLVEQLPSRTVLHFFREDSRQIFTMRKISEGLASNVALVVQMAELLGVSDSEIQERLLRWEPSAFRGEIVETGEKRIFVDCYNANPVAMEDSLRFFQEISAGTGGRLYVIGCMLQLGPESAGYHRDLGRRIRLDGLDRVLILGPEQEREALAAGLVAGGNRGDQISVFGRIDEIEEEVLGHRGFVFVKGSRAYELEELVEKVVSQEGKC